jgi:hypothetical protein
MILNIQSLRKLNLRQKSFQFYTHSDTDFGLEVDQFPSESLCQRRDGVFGRRVHDVKVSWRSMAKTTGVQK